MTRVEYTNDEQFPDDFECVPGPLLLEKEKHAAIINPKKGFSTSFLIDDDLRSQIADAKSGKYWLVFCGNAVYRDIFKDVWAYEFCYQFHNPAAPHEIGVCPTGNEEMPIANPIAPTVKARERRVPILLPEVPRFDR
jgi:hypothetical protein